MILLKTIGIFLKNKIKEMQVIENFLFIAAILSIVSFVVFLLSIIGFFCYHSETIKYILEVKRVIGVYSFHTCWEYALIGFLAIMYLISAIGAVFIAGILIFMIFGLFIPFIIRNSPEWYKTFKGFIVDNWKLAKILSGKDVRYILKCNVKNKGEMVFQNYYSRRLYYDSAFMSYIKGLKHSWQYNEFLFTDDQRIKTLENLNFKNFIKERKISNLKWIKFSEYIKTIK